MRRRRSRFRTTAPPTVPLTVIPTRVRRRPSATKQVRYSPAQRFPRRVTRAKSPRRRRESYARTCSHRQAVTPLLAAGSEDAATVLGLHARKEAVDALTAPVVRLVGPLHERVLLDEVGPPGKPVGATAKYTGPPAAPSRKVREMRIVPDLSIDVDRAVERAASEQPPNPRRCALFPCFRACGKGVDRSARSRRHAGPQPVEKWTTPGENRAGSHPRRANPHRSFPDRHVLSRRPGLCGR